jgi:4-amino-4-deoxy-L-arabinose transferase-like glycosyltransferase
MPTSPPQSSADAWLAARRRRVMLCLASLAALVRAVYLWQLAGGPLLHWHRFEQSDNRFFHEWGQRIAAGDLLQPAPLHPFFDWHRQVAREVFRRHPEALAALAGPDGTSPASEEEAARRLWDRWYGGPTFHQEPLYPYLVGLSYRLFGPDPRVVFVWQQALGVLGVLLLFAIARRLFGDLRAAIAGALLALCSPVFFYELLLLRDSLIVFWGLLLVWLWQVANERERGWLWALGGLAGGLALLLKSTFALPLAAMAAHRLATRRREPCALLRSLLPATIGLALALLPAVARNAAVGAPPLALQSVGTVTFVAANTADAPAGAGFYVNVSLVGRILHESGGRFSSALALTLRTHPSAFGFLALLGAKLFYSFHWYEIPVNADLAVFRAFSPVLGLPVTFGLIGPLALLGLGICGRRGLRRSWPLLVLAGAHLLAMIVMHPCSRYRAPMTAALVPFAAAGLAWLFEQARARQARRLAAGGVALLALLLAVHLPTSERMRVPRPDYLVQPHLFYTSPKADQLAAAGQPLDAAIEVEKSLFWERIFLPDALDDPPSPERARLAYVAAAIREECAARFLLAGDIGRAGRNLIRAGELWAWRARAI